MKYTIFGFSQQLMVENNLSLSDASVLRFIVDFYHTGKMKKVIISGKEYIWVNYRYVSDNLPIIHVGYKSRTDRANKKRVTDCITSLCDAGILEKYVQKDAQGTFVYVRIMEEMYDRYIAGVTTGKVTGCHCDGNGVTTRKVTKDYSIIDSSIKDKKDIPPNSRGDECEKEKKDFQVNKDDDGKPEDQSHGDELKKPVAKIPPYYTPEFETFWKMYPSRNGKKNGKKLAFKSWYKVLEENDFGYDYLTERISVLKESYGDYAPDASVWLNNARWEDEYQPPVEYTKEGYVATPIEIKWDVVNKLKEKRGAELEMKANEGVNIADIY